MYDYKLGIVGAGNMANAILNGILRTGVVSPEKIVVSDIDDKKLEIIKNQGVNTVKDNKVLFKNAEFIILAVKPQVAKVIFRDFEKIENLKIISIMAGITKDTLKGFFDGAKVARIMPNTPCLLGEGACAIDASDFDDDGKKLVFDIFKSLGKFVELDEKYFDAVTAVSGSGPAYVYTFIKAMIDAGCDMGLSDKISEELTLQTFVGAVKMVENRTTDIEMLIKNVCSPGGTTIEAVKSFKENNLEEIIKDGMRKCEKRSKELSENA